MNKGLLLLSCAGGLLAYACGADPLYVDETDAVITIQSEGTDYSQYSTYYMPSGVVDLCLQPESGTPSSDAIGGAAGGPAIDPGNCLGVNHASDPEILDAIEESMDSSGYERVSEPEDADVVMLVAHVTRVRGWLLNRAYCYPNYYFSGCVERTDSPEILVPHASIVVQMIDRAASDDEDLHSVWTAAVHQNNRIESALGTDLGGGPSDVRADIFTDALDAAFLQSPYLSRGGND